MNRLISAPLDLDQFQTVKDGETCLNLSVWSYWADHGYPVEAITGAWTVINDKVEDINTSHIVVKVETLEKPLDEADVAADGTELYACDCRDYQYNRSVDLQERYLTEWDDCKHIRAVSREAKANADDNQQTL